MTASTSQVCAKRAPTYFAALVGMEDHSIDVAAVDSGGHALRPLGQGRVVVLTHGEAGQSPGGEVRHGGEVELAFVSGILSQIAAQRWST